MPLAPQQIRTFFVTSNTQGRRNILQSAAMAQLFIAVLADNRAKARFLLHEFVLMPDHFHLLITPAENVPLEKTVQYVKGGFSFRAKKELGFNGEIWQESFANHRVKNADDYDRHRNYIHHNPVARFLAERAELYPYSSANSKIETDPAPPWLKPSS